MIKNLIEILKIFIKAMDRRMISNRSDLPDNATIIAIDGTWRQARGILHNYGLSNTLRRSLFKFKTLGHLFLEF